MSVRRKLALTGAVFALAACSAFQSKPAVTMSAKDVNLNTRWHGTITSPAELAGVVQMSGTASMTPGKGQGTTDLLLNVSNASPGGVHPWAVRHGQCGADEGVLGELSNYQPLHVGSDGKGSASSTLKLDTPVTGNYYVSVRASAANGETTVACGNLAAPTQ